MPLFTGLACTAGAVCSTRVLDTRSQRLFALALLWAIPCGSKVAGYYLLISLTLAFIGYHIGLLIF